DAVEDAVLAQVLLVDTQYVRRSGSVGLHVIVELIAIDVAQVARLVYPQDDFLEKAVETSERLLRRHLLEIPGPDGALHRFEQRVLAGALLLASEHERVVDLLLRALHPMGEPLDDVLRFLAEDLVDVLAPGTGLGRIARLERRRSVEVEAGHPV